MTTHTFQLDLVTPASACASAKVAMVEVPGAEGDFGVLSGHAPMISMIRPGVVAIHTKKDSAKTDRWFITAGYVDVTPESCTILAETAENVADVSLAEAKERVSEAEKAVHKAHTELSMGHARTRLEHARLLLEAVQAA